MLTTQQKPLDRMLAAFPDAHQKRNGYWAHDDNPRFDFRETPEGNIRIKSWTGRSVDTILSMGKMKLTRGMLYAKGEAQRSQVQHRDKLDLLDLAEHTCIDWQWYMQEGYTDGYTYEFNSGDKVTCVKLGGCKTKDGQEHTKHQVRISLNGKNRFYWNQNTYGDILPFGLHHLDWARAAGYLFLCEGNSDWATFTFHRLPSLGIPGADQARKLDVELVKDIPRIYIIEEPDQAQKLQRSGQGFYKNVRQHLREQGYQGEIFAINFMEVTGHKDPSDLHKSIYAQCQEQAEGPFRREVHNQFLAAIEQAMSQALPEGNESIFPVAKARDWSKISFEEFSRLVWKAPAEYLSPIQKMIICYLFLYMKEVEPGPLGWQIDAEKMAPEVGLRGPKGKKTFLAHLAYLQQKVGILSKAHRARKEYQNGEDEPEQFRYKGMDLYIEPRANFYVPGSYCVVTQDQHQQGGPRESEKQEEQKPAPDLSRVPTECDYCGSTHVRPYAAECLEPDCGHVTYPPVEEDEPVGTVIESTLQDSIPESPKMGSSGNEETEPLLESITEPQNGVVGNLFFNQVTRSPSIDGLPTRMTYCCNFPFQWGPDGTPECSNPACEQKAKARTLELVST